jgi:hypothetical protein
MELFLRNSLEAELARIDARQIRSRYDLDTSLSEIDRPAFEEFERIFEETRRRFRSHGVTSRLSPQERQLNVRKAFKRWELDHEGKPHICYRLVELGCEGGRFPLEIGTDDTPFDACVGPLVVVRKDEGQLRRSLRRSLRRLAGSR